jgi:hypothetical protein
MKFHASLDKVVMDKDGECKITLCVPLIDRVEVLKLAEHTEIILKVNVETEVPYKE